jgi:Family of unknown function (DUF6328)
MPAHARTPVKTKIEQMLTEAGVIIPGGQALLGFQFVCTFTRSFKELPLSIQYLHAAGLCAVALAVLLLMTPAALHRIAFHGEDDPGFFSIGSALVVTASIPYRRRYSRRLFQGNRQHGECRGRGRHGTRCPARRLAGISCLAAEFGGSSMIAHRQVGFLA